MTVYRRFFLSALLALACCFSPLRPAPAQNAKPSASLNNKLNAKLRLTDGARTVVRTRRELGFRIASKPGQPVAFTVDRGALKDALARIGKTFRQSAVNAKPFVYRGQVQIDPGSYSRALNVPTTAERIAQTVAKNPAATKFTVALDKKPPVLTAQRLKGINGVLASFGTSAAPNAKRNKNIRLSVNAIDGTLLSPGETFSLNGTVGKRTQARGFRTAPVFLNAEKVPGIGGGVSQVTGTLFNAAALSGLKIVEVHPHSRPVAYIPIGRDATVAWEESDLKFKNDTNAPVYIEYTFRNQRLQARLYGRKTPGQQVSLRPRVQRLAPGKIDAQLYRVVKRAGKVVAKERLFNHQYRWDPKKKA